MDLLASAQMLRLGLVLLLAGTASCVASEGPLLVDTRARDAASTSAGAQAGDATAPDSAVSTPGDSGQPEAPSGPVEQGMRLQYQLVGTADPDVAADLFVIDLFETQEDELAALKQAGKVVVAYVAAGSHEPWRPDSDDFPEAALGEALMAYPSERWLDIRNPSVRTAQTARLQRAADQGFDGVVLTSLDAYQQNTGFDLTAQDQLDYNLLLASAAKSLGLSVGLTGDWGQAEQLAPAYDFAIHINCIAAGRCADLQPYERLGRPVFDLETGSDRDSLCAQASALGLPVTLKRAGFDGWLEFCP